MLENPSADTSGQKSSISGWVAWWDGNKAYDLIDKHYESFDTISPVWYMLSENFDLTDISEDDRLLVVDKLHSLGIEVYPTLGSELSGEKLSPFLNDGQAVEAFVQELINSALELKVDGIDIDLEGIGGEDKDEYTDFVKKITTKAHEHNLKISIAVHARGPIAKWEGALGQDLKELGGLVDEVRIMTYDFHSSASVPGAISPLWWLAEVGLYNSLQMDKQKIVIGLSSYGYIWTVDDTRGYQHDEFMEYIKDFNYDSRRDTSSQELVVKNADMEGWLSDSDAMIAKIKKMNSIGFHRFVIWHVGGMDESFFDKMRQSSI